MSQTKLISLDNLETFKNNLDNYGATALKINDTVVAVDKTPFLMRPIPPLSTPYVRERLVGVSVVLNQLVQNGNFADTSVWTAGNSNVSASNNILTMTATATNGNIRQNIDTIAGHAYLCMARIKTTTITNSTVKLQLRLSQGMQYYSAPTNANWNDLVFVKKATESYASYLRIIDERTSDWDAIQVQNVQLIDLTIAFTPAIADRIYSMEQAQAGSGIAWIKSYGFLTEPYYAYNAGGIQSVCADRKVVTGFNLWDEEWETGDINSTTGENTTSSSIWRTKNYIPIIPSKSYYAYCSSVQGTSTLLRARFYDSNKNYIGAKDFSNNNVYIGVSFVPPEDAAYLRFALANSTNSDHIVCINLSDTSRNGTYEPYHQTTISLGHDELRGIPKLDANNEIYYDGDEKTADGTVTRKSAILTNQTGAVGDTITLTGYKTNGWFICDQGILSEVGTISGTTLTLTKALSAATIEYELATPTTTQSTPFQSPQYLFDGGTEEFVDYDVENGIRDVAIPVGHVTEYLGAGENDKFYLPAIPEEDNIYLLTAKNENSIKQFMFDPLSEILSSINLCIDDGSLCWISK